MIKWAKFGPKIGQKWPPGGGCRKLEISGNLGILAKKTTFSRLQREKCVDLGRCAHQFI